MSTLDAPLPTAADAPPMVPPSAAAATAEPPTLAAAPEPPPAPEPGTPLDPAAQDQLFRTARTTWSFSGRDVPDDALRSLYELTRLGPTSANSSPARFMFLRTAWARERLRASLSEGNADKAINAPVVCIVAHDPKFYEELPRLYPGADARAWFAGNDDLADVTAFRNGTLQAAYLILAARTLGLACGPMSGFDNDRLDSEFLVAQGWRSNLLVALGYPGAAPAAPRAPRLSFDEACRLL